ncbi:hypothetical protein C8R45DRAFT_1148587 [Mycena sanguinolenta]|nr:hypothetical protein C8R45DRAFT_1148587 [Mycena sanguinolenta]
MIRRSNQRFALATTPRAAAAEQQVTYSLVTAHLPGIGRDVLTLLYYPPPPCFLLLQHCTDTTTQLPLSTQHVPRYHGLRRGQRVLHQNPRQFHDGFQGTASWAGFLPDLTTSSSTRTRTLRMTARRTTHRSRRAGTRWRRQNVAEAGVQPVEVVLENELRSPITFLGPERGRVTAAGEFSNGYNDCVLYLTGVNGTQHYGGDCLLDQDESTWTDTTKACVNQHSRRWTRRAIGSSGRGRLHDCMEELDRAPADLIDESDSITLLWNQVLLVAHNCTLLIEYAVDLNEGPAIQSNSWKAVPLCLLSRDTGILYNNRPRVWTLDPHSPT